MEQNETFCLSCFKLLKINYKKRQKIKTTTQHYLMNVYKDFF